MQTAITPMIVKDKITKHWDSFGSHCISFDSQNSVVPKNVKQKQIKTAQTEIEGIENKRCIGTVLRHF
jgi:hypothetical protein